MKTIILKFTILFLMISSSVKGQDGIIDFLVISHLGPSDAFFPPLIFSSKKIDSITYNTSSYYEIMKYQHFRNVIIPDNCLINLFKILKVTKDSINIQRSFSLFDKKVILIIDYRKNRNDFELLTIKNLSQILYILKSIYCFSQNWNLENGEFDSLNDLYKYLIDNYNAEDKYQPLINCPQN